jgi:iron(III) transport system substrate-binding protein
MRRFLKLSLVLTVLVALAPLAGWAMEAKLVIYTAYEEKELQTFWTQFQHDLPDLAARATYRHGSTGPVMARVEAVSADPQGDMLWGVLNDYRTGAAPKGLLEPYVARESEALPARFKHPENQWQGVTLLTMAFAVHQQRLAELPLPAPRAWTDLVDPRDRGHIVIGNPATSGTAYLLLASHIARLGSDDRILQYYEASIRTLLR